MMSEWISEIDKARFWSKSTQTNYCWVWSGALNSDSYGQFRLGKKTLLAHRVSYQITRNHILKDGDIVAHFCDNPKCINPYHLFCTDHQGNMTDKQLKGRAKTTLKSSKYTGVGFRNDSMKWRAYVSVEGKRKNLGCFVNETDAAKAYDDYMVASYGLNKCKNALNFPDRLPEPPK